MFSHRRLLKLVVLLIAISLLLVACERPSPRDNTDTTDNDSTEVVNDPNTGGGNSEVEAVEQTTTEETAITAATQTETETSTETEEGGEETAVSEEGGSEAIEETSQEAEPSTEAEESAETTAAETTGEATQTAEPTERPATHTVATGENLYQIGLKYGISWVTLAQHNNLPNAHQLKVGQVLNLPSTGTPPETPTPSPSTETTYVVKAGDNLFRIGLSYGIGWIQIAEANGIINANQIMVGQTIKIPVDAPGEATPQFTHEVKPTETLFKISLQYGVTWNAIATENEIDAPYVIYVGQTLRIPGK